MNKQKMQIFGGFPAAIDYWVSICRWMISIAVIIAGILVMESFIKMIKGNCEVSVVGTTIYRSSTSSQFTGLKIPKMSGTYFFKARNTFDRLFISSRTPRGKGLISTIFNFLIILYLCGMFYKLNLHEPFSLTIAYYIHMTGFTLLIASICNYFTGQYTKHAIQSLTNGQFIPLPDDKGYTVLASMVIIVIAEIYRKGYLLQEEKELTI